MDDNFDQAKTYSESNTRQTEDGLKLIELLNPPIGSSVLDLGCGTGNITRVIADRVRPGTVLGIDIDQKRLNIAKNCYSADNLTYKLAGTDNIPGGDFDLIYSNYVLQWIKDHGVVFGRIASKLKAGGRFAFNIMSAITPEKTQEVLGWASDELIEVVLAPLKGLSVDDVQRLAVENGFEVDHLQSGMYEREYDSVEEYIEVAFLAQGQGTREMYDVEKIRKFFGPGKIKEIFKTTIAILRKESV